MITSCEVHYAIQQLNNKFPGYSIITIDTIDHALHVSSDELLPHLDILSNMYFIEFTDRKNGKIKLTFTGKFAQIAEFAMTFHHLPMHENDIAL